MGVGQMFVRPSFPFGIEGRMWDVIVLIPDHCLSISYSPDRWSPAGLTFTNYLYLFLYLYIITRITINKNTPHLKSPKNQKRRAALERPEINLRAGDGGGGG